MACGPDEGSDQSRLQYRLIRIWCNRNVGDSVANSIERTGLRPIYVIFFELLPISFQMKKE